MNNRNVWYGAPCVLIAFIAIFVRFEDARRRSEEERPFGRLSRLDLRTRERTLKLIGLLPGNSTLSTSRLEIKSSGEENKRFWMAEFSDPAGEFTGHAQWDADTGELTTFSRKRGRPLLSIPTVTRSEAVSHVRRLLKQTGIGIPVDRWQLSYAAPGLGGIWHILVTSAQRRAYIYIDMQSDQVNYLHIVARGSNSLSRYPPAWTLFPPGGRLENIF